MSTFRLRDVHISLSHEKVDDICVLMPVNFNAVYVAVIGLWGFIFTDRRRLYAVQSEHSQWMTFAERDARRGRQINQHDTETTAVDRFDNSGCDVVA